MIQNMNLHYGYNDVAILPAVLSAVSSRKEVNPYVDDETKQLPIFTAPMDSIVSVENYEQWKNAGIIPIIPRNIDKAVRKQMLTDNSIQNTPWVAVSLHEFENWFCHVEFYSCPLPKTINVLIDIANGHMEKTLNLIKEAKEIALVRNIKLVVMAGNIANPDTYLEYCNAGVDYVRLGIGSGSMCTTSSNTAIHYPMASLVDECAKMKIDWERDCYYTKEGTKIIADGGIRNYSDVIKALALGADYVMIGGMFSAFWESAAPINEMIYKYTEKDKTYIELDESCGFATIEDTDSDERKRYLIKNFNFTKSSHGMSTKEAQRNIDENAKLKTAEGITIKQPVKYTITQWVENFTDYLRSAMSYTNSTILEDFKNANVIIISNATQLSVNK